MINAPGWTRPLRPVSHRHDAVSPLDAAVHAEAASRRAGDPMAVNVILGREDGDVFSDD
jgi:hypothetical protein